ncbi:putative lipid II flippase FtsW [Ammoniphilus sp. YIM 78166]|uniref:putative lipid II flippase FtsW n=1 Tax=Ammoniphilus sp. YIM 78166 TaxID=1644106 RepID=UPI00106FD5CC|nr:putative lipid II flippase FtsW [Ammoniphilus sp. YIM 78166]
MPKSRGIPDFLLLFMTLALVGFGILMVFSASYILAYNDPNYSDSLYFVKKQVMWAIIGFVAMLVTMNIPYTFYKKHFPLILILSVCLLFLLHTPLGVVINGARSWIRIGPFSFQPAEFAKLGLIIYLAGLIAKKGDKFRSWKKGLFPALIVSGTFFIAIASHDFGGGFILFISALAVIFAGGAHLKQLAALCIPVAAAGLLLILTTPYRLARITTFLDPWNDGMNGLGTGFQLIQSLYAIAHGSFYGVGFGKSIQKYLYLPYPQTDFIFAVMAEEFGLVGCMLYLAFFILFLWRIVHITLKCQDVFAKLIGIGVVSMISIQAFVNMGGVTGIIPITGVTLPFISYGGTSLLICMISMGLILSISRENSKQVDTKPSAKGVGG